MVIRDVRVEPAYVDAMTKPDYPSRKPFWEVKRRIPKSMRSKPKWCMNCGRQWEVAKNYCVQCGCKTSRKTKPR